MSQNSTNFPFPCPARFIPRVRSPDLLVPLGNDCLIYVGPADYPAEPGRLADLDHFRVFRVRQGQAVLLRPGVWHGAPLAIDDPLNVVVILLSKTSQEDGHVVHFEETPVLIGR